MCFFKGTNSHQNNVNSDITVGEAGSRTQVHKTSAVSQSIMLTSSPMRIETMNLPQTVY